MQPVALTHEVIWVAEEDSDEDGYMNQKSFALSTQTAMNMAGEITGVHAYVQGCITAGVSKLGRHAKMPAKETQIADREIMLDEEPALDEADYEKEEPPETFADETVEPWPDLLEMRFQHLGPAGAIEDIWNAYEKRGDFFVLARSTRWNAEASLQLAITFC